MIASFVLAAAVATTAAPALQAEPQARVVQIAQPREAVALLSCMVKSNGGLTDCSVQAESPTDLGVGDAALQMASQIQVELLGPDGKSRAGSFIDVPIRIRIR